MHLENLLISKRNGKITKHFGFIWFEGLICDCELEVIEIYAI